MVKETKIYNSKLPKRFYQFLFPFQITLLSLWQKYLNISILPFTHHRFHHVNDNNIRHYQKIDWVWSQQGRKKTNNETNSYKCKINALFRRKRKFISKKYHEFVYITRNLLSFIKINIIFNEKCPKFCIEKIFYN